MSGTTTILGTAGDDTINGTAGRDTILGSDGNDWIEGGSGRDTLEGGSGDDVIWGGGGRDRLFGGDGDDILVADIADRIVSGGDGFDTLQLLDATRGGNTTYESIEQVLLYGEDIVFDASGFGAGLTIYTWDGITAEVTATGLADVLLAGTQAGTTFHGGAGDDSIFSLNAGGNAFHGDAGNDSLAAASGDNLLDGGAGDDRLMASLDGRNTMTGGSGADTFALTTAAGKAGSDVITDFTVGEDRIDLQDQGLALEQLAITQSGNSVVVAVNGYTLILENMQAASVDAQMFIF